MLVARPNTQALAQIYDLYTHMWSFFVKDTQDRLFVHCTLLYSTLLRFTTKEKKSDLSLHTIINIFERKKE